MCIRDRYKNRSVIISHGTFPNNTAGTTTESSGSDLTCFHEKWTYADQVNTYAGLTYVHEVTTNSETGWLYFGLALDVGSNYTQIAVNMILDPVTSTLKEYMFAQNWPNEHPTMQVTAIANFTNVTMGTPPDSVFELPSVCPDHGFHGR
eukprot:TRINITY_DN7856_c0_g1_i2.p1 TRINITY_DN7856_c0_g1~~TRINITY_DN7856_c0_g1_i2.p1  ORF type:complete len:149 (-),score=14.00 TRINITY_DN7856_c0_g1_i2:266-712(-)